MVKMDSKVFFLGTTENNRTVKILKIVFGIVCIGIAVYWFSFNIKSLISDSTLWITIVFLTGFGAYQVWAGLGRAAIYIKIGISQIKLKRNPILPPVEMNGVEIDKIELFPLSLVFCLKSRKRLLLRFGTTYHDTNEKVVDEIMKFANINHIPIEIVEEKL